MAWVKIYADLVRKGLKTIDEVPAKFRDDVKKLLGIEEE